MDQSTTNLSAFNFSPHFWWKTIERGISFTDAFAKDLYPEVDFRTWLQAGIIEHSTLDIYDTEANGIPHIPEYTRMVSNSYYHEVAAQNKYGHNVNARSLELLYNNRAVAEDAKITFSFKVDGLQHIAMQHFMSWLVLGTHFHWVRWQLYFDFIIRKAGEPLKEMYYYMWNIIMIEIDFHHHFFEKVDQYKLLRYKQEEISALADVFENKFTTYRDLVKRKTD